MHVGLAMLSLADFILVLGCYKAMTILHFYAGPGASVNYCCYIIILNTVKTRFLLYKVNAVLFWLLFSFKCS